MTQFSNQFAQTPEAGYLDLQSGLNNVITSMNVVGASAALVPGQGVTLVDSFTAIPSVAAMTADTQIAWGFVVQNLKDADVPAEKPCEIARAGTVMFMTAGAAIARGANVSYQVATGKVITQATTDTIAGQALDKAAADGDIIRVIINPAAAPV